MGSVRSAGHASNGLMRQPAWQKWSACGSARRALRVVPQAAAALTEMVNVR